MSYHHEFHLAEDEFLEEVDNQEQLDGAGGADDVALDEYEMVYLFILILPLFYCLIFVSILGELFWF